MNALDEMRERLGKYTGPLRVVLDVGAHTGAFSLAAAEKGSDLIFAVEPDPANYNILMRNVISNDLWGTVVPLPCAVGIGLWSKGKLRMAGTNSGQRSLVYNEAKSPVAFQVRVVDLWWLLAQVLPPVDYLKMDIEGGEWALLAAEQRLLMREGLSRVGYIDIELHPLSNTDYFNGGDNAEIALARQRVVDAGFDLEDVGRDVAPAWRGFRR